MFDVLLILGTLGFFLITGVLVELLDRLMED